MLASLTLRHQMTSDQVIIMTLICLPHARLFSRNLQIGDLRDGVSRDSWSPLMDTFKLLNAPLGPEIDHDVIGTPDKMLCSRTVHSFALQKCAIFNKAGARHLSQPHAF